MTITSPCTGICKLEDATGWCLGCGRTGDEIAFWGGLPEPKRQEVWDVIPDRLADLGVACRRLPWSTDDIRRFVVRTLKEGQGTWVMGPVGAVAEFTAAKGEAVQVSVEGDDILARTWNGAIRMRVDDHIRALTFDPPAQATPPRVMLAVKRDRGRLPVADGLGYLGDDRHPLIKEDARQLYDLGLGRKEGRFLVRVGDGASKIALDNAASLAFDDALPRIGAALVADSPTRIVESALGRIEVQGQIPPPNAQSPDGPHTHLLPDHIATGRATPVGMDLPRVYLPGAIYYPPRQA